jgi:hypothetical protein
MGVAEGEIAVVRAGRADENEAVLISGNGCLGAETGHRLAPLGHRQGASQQGVSCAGGKDDDGGDPAQGPVQDSFK